MGARGASLKTLTDLVQEGVTDVTDVTDVTVPQPRDLTVAGAILTSVRTPQLDPPGGSMVAEDILTLKK